MVLVKVVWVKVVVGLFFHFKFSIVGGVPAAMETENWRDGLTEKGSFSGRAFMSRYFRGGSFHFIC